MLPPLVVPVTMCHDSIQQGHSIMKRFSVLYALAAAALILPVQARTPQQERMKTCNAEATRKNLKADERKTYMSQCLSRKTEVEAAELTPQQLKMQQCNLDANSQNLKGNARKTFMKDCLSK